MQFLGVDGGGTKTDFVVVDEKGKTLANTNKGTLHLRQVSREAFQRILKEGLEELENQLGGKMHLDYAFFALPGYGEFPEGMKEMQRIVASMMKSPFKLGNDVLAGWAASLGGKTGIHLVMGTGSIAYGQDKNGNEARVGGWGPFCGDEGSAYWLGKKCIRLFTKQADGRREKSHLYRLMRERFELDQDFDLIDILVKDLQEDRREIAQLSKVLYEAAEKGDVSAQEMFSLAAKEGAQMVKALLACLDFEQEEKILLGCSGGVFRAEKWILEPLKEALAGEKMEFTKEKISPVKGAALLAAKAFGIEIHKEDLISWKD